MTNPGDAEPANDVLESVDWLDAAEVATALGVPVTRVNQLARDGQLIGRRTGGAMRVPAVFVDTGVVLKYLPGVITLMRDGGYSDEEVLRWLFTPDDSLPGRPIDALRDQRHKEVTRRAQAMAI